MSVSSTARPIAAARERYGSGWREHLELDDDEQLRAVVHGLRVVDGHRSLQELREQINLKAQAVGVLPCNAADSDFRYDELARQLKVRRLSALNREALLQICKEEGLLVERSTEPDQFLSIAIRSFLGPAADIVGAAPEDTLLLTDDFRQRYLQEGREWQRDIRPRVSVSPGRGQEMRQATVDTGRARIDCIPGWGCAPPEVRC